MTRVLIVEDSPTQACQLQLILERAAFEVDVATDGQSGLARFQQSPYDVVMSDVVMPGMSGYEMCRRIKTGASKYDVPVILLTALNEPADIIEGLLCGADNFITKPYDAEYLVARVQNVVANQRIRSERRVHAGVEIQFLGKRVTIDADKQQILDLLISAIEEVHRTKQREDELRIIEQKQRAEVECHRTHEERLRKDKEELRSIVETMPMAVAIVCSDGKIHFANRAFLHVSRAASRTTLQEWAAGLEADTELPDTLNRLLSQSLDDDGHPVRLEATFKLHDRGELHWVLVLQRLPAEIAGKPAVMVAGVDVTDQKQLILQLSNARAQMEDFLAAAAHDLKAPLITIGHNLTFARNSLGTEIRPETADCLNRVQSAARGMQSLLGQVSEVAHAGRDTEPRLRHSSRELVRSALRQLEGVLAERKAEVSLADDLPDLYCQGTKLIQVFSNLISNAVKYTPAHRTPRIEIGSRRCSATEQLLFVRDNGVGIPRECQDQVFELFRRLTTDPGVDGQGVGLTIVKRIVELHGGRVWLESVPGEGSTFYFTIRQKGADRDGPQGPAPAVARHDELGGSPTATAPHSRMARKGNPQAQTHACSS